MAEPPAAAGRPASLSMPKKTFGSARQDKVMFLIAQFCCVVIAVATHGRCSFHLLGAYPEDITFLSPPTYVMDVANMIVLITIILFFVMCLLDQWSYSPLLTASNQGWGTLACLLSAMTFCFISIHPKSLFVWFITSVFGLLNLGVGLEKLYRGCGLRALSEETIRIANPSAKLIWIQYFFGISLSVSKAWFIVLINICLIHTSREAIQVHYLPQIHFPALPCFLRTSLRLRLGSGRGEGAEGFEGGRGGVEAKG